MGFITDFFTGLGPIFSDFFSSPSLEGLVGLLNYIVWSPFLIILLLFAGVYFTVRTGAVQVRRVKLMAKLLFSGGSSDRGVSSFQAFALSVAGRVGTGNIAGVAVAISLGGPGALFWMWVIATLGSASAYVESTLAQIYKEEVDGEFRGGPAYYFEKFTGKRIFGVIFAVITVVSMALFLPGGQTVFVAGSIQQAFFEGTSNPDLVKLIIGVVVALILGVIIFGGTKSLSRAAEIIVPFMSIAYMVIALIIIVINITQVPHVFALIFEGAFNPQGLFGGALGATIMNGVKRGIYSNEAGQGTGPHAAAAAEVNHPAEQGLVQAFSVYFDTLLVCSATGFMIIITGCYNIFGASGELLENGGGIGENVVAGPAFTQSAVATLLGDNIGPKFVAIALFFFAFTTLMAYSYMAESNMAYLTAKKNEDGSESSNFIARVLVRIVFLVVLVFFSYKPVGVVIDAADIGVGIMAWYNVIGILIISAPALIALKDYEKQLADGVEKPTFDPEKLGIKNTEVW